MSSQVARPGSHHAEDDMRFVGLDVHKRVVEAAVVDAAGVLLFRDRFPCTREELTRFASTRLIRSRASFPASCANWRVMPSESKQPALAIASNLLLFITRASVRWRKSTNET